MKIVVLDGYTLNPGDLSWEELKTFGDLDVYDRTPPDKVIERASGASILFTNKTPVGEEIINQLPTLKYIGVLATGYNVIAIEYAKAKGIKVTNVPGYGTTSVVQHTFALRVELCHRVQNHSDTVYSGTWSKSPDFCYWETPQVELFGKTLGIIGFGNIGEQVADIASAFGMNILATSRTHSDQRHRKNFQWATVSEVLTNSDIVSIHCPLFAETKGLINQESLQLMKKSSFLINTSRGPIIVEKDLADALNNNSIAGAAVDVLSEEPPALDNPLFHAKNCIITPHIAWATKAARSRLMDISIKNLSSYLNGNPMNVVNN
jgi:glycerate dehydrogenase